jgi:hypothetical protein
LVDNTSCTIWISANSNGGYIASTSNQSLIAASPSNEKYENIYKQNPKTSDKRKEKTDCPIRSVFNNKGKMKGKKHYTAYTISQDNFEPQDDIFDLKMIVIFENSMILGFY